MKIETKFRKMKANADKIILASAFDYCNAKMLDQSFISGLIVEDITKRDMQGNEVLINGEIDNIYLRSRAVVRGAQDKFIITSLPYCITKYEHDDIHEFVSELMNVGVDAVKLEGGIENKDLIKMFVKSGIPVMGHIGSTTSPYNAIGGARFLINDFYDIQTMLYSAQMLEALGCFAVILEFVPDVIGKAMTELLNIPVIGLDAGKEVDGQLIIVQDLPDIDDVINCNFTEQNNMSQEEILFNTIYLHSSKMRIRKTSFSGNKNELNTKNNEDSANRSNYNKIDNSNWISSFWCDLN